MSINVDLLVRTLDHIETHPEDWVQESWARTYGLPEGNVCGTAYCFAGHAALIDGARIDWRNGLEYGIAGTEGQYDADGAEGGEWTPDGKCQLSIGQYARKALGLSDEQALRLFAGYNTLDDLHRIVDELVAEAES